MKARHRSHKCTEWFDVIDSDPDCDFETGEYVGMNNMLKLSDGNWYDENQCVYMLADGEIKQCSSPSV